MSENRNGLLVGLCVMVATGTAEREGALKLIYNAVPGTRRITVGSDKGYDTKDFVAESRHMNATPHVARKKHSALDERYAGTQKTQRSMLSLPTPEMRVPKKHPLRAIMGPRMSAT